MLNTFFAFIGFFGGLFFYFLDIATFKVTVPRAIKILEFFLACIPLVGVVLMLGFYIAKVFCHSRSPWTDLQGYSCDYFEPCVRYNRINRYLFNDIDWDIYDKYQKEAKHKQP